MAYTAAARQEIEMDEGMRLRSGDSGGGRCGTVRVVDVGVGKKRSMDCCNGGRSPGTNPVWRVRRQVEIASRPTARKVNWPALMSESGRNDRGRDGEGETQPYCRCKARVPGRSGRENKSPRANVEATRLARLHTAVNVID